MGRLGPHLLPLAVFVLVPGTFIITYVISVTLGHTEVDFPYISDTGTYSPESCIFAQLLNVAAVIIALCVYVRYRQVVEYCNYGTQTVPRLNAISLWIGWVAAFGVSVVGNFQETNVIVVHTAGAVLAFGFGLIYAWMNTLMSYKMHPHLNGIAICHIRLTLSSVATICFVLTKLFESLAENEFHGTRQNKWHPSDGGFTYHVISTVSEWLLALAYMIYFLTYAREFHKLSLSPPHVHLHTEDLPFSTSIHTSIDSTGLGSGAGVDDIIT